MGLIFLCKSSSFCRPAGSFECFPLGRVTRTFELPVRATGTLGPDYLLQILFVLRLSRGLQNVTRNRPAEGRPDTSEY
jgi:hypothetical protein